MRQRIVPVLLVPVGSWYPHLHDCTDNVLSSFTTGTKLNLHRVFNDIWQPFTLVCYDRFASDGYLDPIFFLYNSVNYFPEFFLVIPVRTESQVYFFNRFYFYFTHEMILFSLLLATGLLVFITRPTHFMVRQLL